MWYCLVFQINLNSLTNKLPNTTEGNMQNQTQTNNQGYRTSKSYYENIYS